MKKVVISVAMMLFGFGVQAQSGTPKELTCTERAFNFSFSFGSKWKFSAPKMGPVEAKGLTYDPLWRLKVLDTVERTKHVVVKDTVKFFHF